MKEKIASLWHNLVRDFGSLKTLVAMQLKEKMDMSYLKSRRKTLFKGVWFFLEFAIITAIIALLFYVVKLFGIFSLVKDVPTSVISGWITAKLAKP